MHYGGTTGQAETTRDGPGPGRVRGYLTLIRYHESWVCDLSWLRAYTH